MRASILVLLAAAGMCGAGSAPAEETASRAEGVEPADATPPIEYLVPELADDPYKLSDGPRAFQRRLVFSPGFGKLGDERLYTMRIGYNPNSWLGYEVSLGHNPGESVHALFHIFNAVVRYPLPGRFQPYAQVGYGMMHVYPGRLFNADPVTKNALSAGLGLEVYIRDDVALRGEWRRLTVIGGERDRDVAVAYDYGEATLGFAFYRSLGQ